MEYRKETVLKNGRSCVIRSACGDDACAVLENMERCSEQSDFLLAYPDERTFTPEMEERFLEERLSAPREALLVAELDGCIAASAGLFALGGRYKLSHRAELAVSVDSGYWGLGLGRALTRSIIECAKDAGYAQLELTVVEDNIRAVSLYRSLGFSEFGRLERGFRSRISGWQAILMMLLPLDRRV